MQRCVVRGVSSILDGDRQTLCNEDEKPEIRIVFIGRSLPEPAIGDWFERRMA